MAIFIAKGKIYVVPRCDIRNYTHAVLVMPERTKNAGVRPALISLLIELFWMVPGSNLKAQACGL